MDGVQNCSRDAGGVHLSTDNFDLIKWHQLLAEGSNNDTRRRRPYLVFTVHSTISSDHGHTKSSGGISQLPVGRCYAVANIPLAQNHIQYNLPSVEGVSRPETRGSNLFARVLSRCGARGSIHVGNSEDAPAIWREAYLQLIHGFYLDSPDKFHANILSIIGPIVRINPHELHCSDPAFIDDI